jgi:16S rRNA (adenine1518-N6/adenine1519-N6)-dimethyltransferase
MRQRPGAALTRAKKRYGQHFLHDPGAIDRIVSAIAPRPGDRIVEVGPGRGAITLPLLAALGSLDVIEIDADVVPRLEERCAGRGELRVHLADALEFDFRRLRGDGPRLRLVGNLPYNISTPLLFHFIDQLDAIASMHFMLQKEVVARMAARPGGKDYGRLTVMLAPRVRVEPLFDIGTGAFSPPPRVVSTFFALHPHAAPPFAIADPAAYARVVSAAFGQRRKTLRNSLAALLDAKAISAAGVDPGARPETLAPEQFAALAAQVRS